MTPKTKLLTYAVAAALIVVALGIFVLWRDPVEDSGARLSESLPESHAGGLSGSSSCQPCHERFYQLWAPSHHGLAMQPFTEELARTQLVAHSEAIQIGKQSYRAEIERGPAAVIENGPAGRREYRLEHALGGKNVYYFLTPMERGRLQVVPLAFDVRKREWFNTTGSMVRHFSDRADEALDWRERPLTFNTSCYGCHVSQLSTNYDLETDTYETAWAEPGINCETCHGPCGEHVRVCSEASEGEIPDDIKLMRATEYSIEQRNAMCAPCHAKMRIMTPDIEAAGRFFDHFDLITFEDADFYPDGRDLGENYTYTHWLMSPCVKSGELDCLHCHTSSGRYRFQGADANKACLPCHRKHVEGSEAHSHHAAGSKGSECVSCHMPMTFFSRMARSDHSMRPPTPATTIAYKSPNACNLCHTDQDATWADKWVRKWRERDYQAPILHLAGLIDAARKQDFSRASEMFTCITAPDRDEVYATSFIRLLDPFPSRSKLPVLLEALQDSSPLVRSAAAAALEPFPTPQVRDVLLKATGDEHRLVRLRAAAALSTFAPELFEEHQREKLLSGFREYEGSLGTRLDQWTSHYNLGNYHYHRRDLPQALSSFETAMRLEPSAVAPHANAAFAYNLMGQNDKAEESLRRALKLRPDDAGIHFNLGLLLGEEGDRRGAEKAFRAALKADPTSAVAAYNLGVLLAPRRLEEAIQWCRKASELEPGEARYGYTHAFYLHQSGDYGGASKVIEGVVGKHPGYAEAHMLLGTIHEEQGRVQEATSVYLKASENEQIPEHERFRFTARLEALRSR